MSTNKIITEKEIKEVDQIIENPKKKFNAKEYYQANKEKLKKKYQEKKQLNNNTSEKVFCDICECYYTNSHKSKHFITDKHMLRDLLKILKKSVNDEKDIEEVNQINEKECEFSFDNIYCYKI
jgi:hypothetical protein